MAVVQTDRMGTWEPVVEEEVRLVPNPTSFETALRIVLMEIEGLLLKKRHDYGRGNIMKFGELGVLVRASDKVERLINLIDKDVANDDETKSDSWRDLAGYAVLAIMLSADWFELPDQERREGDE